MATPPKPEDSFPDRKWEDALAFVAPKDGDLAKVTNRTDVTKDPWFKTDHVAVSDTSGDAGPPSGYDYGWSQGWAASGGKRYTYQVGFSLTPEVGDNGPDTALSKFIHEPWAIIGPPLNTLIGNSSISVGSFDDGAMMLRNVLNHMDFVENDIKTWVKDINVPDSEMQGTAAGAFKRVLVAVQQQVAYLHQEVVNRGDIPALIDSARVKLHDAMFALVTAADTFRNAPGGWPATHVHDIFFNAMAGANLTFSSDRGSVTLDVPELGNPAKPEFWSTLEQKSKDAWLKGVADVLDIVAKPQMGYVQTAYQAAIDVIPASALTRPPYRDLDAPKPPGDDTNSGDKKPPGDDTNTGDKKPPGDDTNTGDKKPPGDDTNTGDKKPPGDDTNTGDKPPGSGITGPPKTESNVPPPPPQLKTTGPPQTNSGVGAGNTLLDKNNQPIKDSKGNTPDIPPGSHIDPKTGQIIGPDGKPVLGADKKPLIAPPNTHIGPGTTTGNSNSNSKSSQQQLKEQQELAEKQIKQQKVNQQQQLKDQQELQEKQLKQQQLNQQQQLKQRKAQEAQEVEQEKAYQKALSQIRGDARTESSGNGYGNKTGGGGKNKLNLEELPPRVNERLPNSRSIGDPKTSVSERVRTRTSANEPNLAAEESAVRQSSAMNRTSSNGQPMMPPMGGGGGGGGGERDRERRTWLAEDEETWGTSQAAAPGVIG
ncbi:hypothetical protein [Streptomyces sp. NBC_01240]|uniref:hypothetical protein n=1 Tax=Streptomyces sp. NBC_01240 TaxID=2903793 RepID=UPI002E0E68B8|nr:hypothetical protein OG466_18000 [Streptomyces sp. NBC_01240]